MPVPRFRNTAYAAGTPAIIRAIMLRRQAMMKQIEANIEPVAMEMKTQLDARGYLIVDQTYSMVEDVFYPFDPEVVAAIREIIQDFQPINVKYAYQRSWKEGASYLTFARHAFARAVLDPKIPQHEFTCEMPTIESAAYPTYEPNYIEAYIYHSEVRPYGWGVEGEYMPIDWTYYHSIMEGRRQGRSAQEVYEEILKPKRIEDLLRKRSNASEQSYVDKLENERLSKLLPQFSDREIMEYLTGSVPDPEVKQYAFLSTSASAAKPSSPGSDPAPTPES